jgi:HEAT repeat protein
LGDARAFDPLVELLQYPGKNGMRGAAYGLGGLGDVRAIPFLRAALDQIQDEDDAFTIDIIIDALCWLGEPGMTAVLEVIQGALKEPDPYVATRGAFKFGVLGDRRALDLLLREASDADPAIRAAVAESLAWSRFPDEACPALVRLLSDSEKLPYTGRRVRDVAAEALQKMKELQ